jgi:hypothetical protein
VGIRGWVLAAGDGSCHDAGIHGPVAEVEAMLAAEKE